MKYNKDLDYCTSSPDSILGVKFNYACFIHDRHYRNEIKCRKTRKEADILFRKMIFREFKKRKLILWGLIISRIYYIGVRLFGEKYYVK